MLYSPSALHMTTERKKQKLLKQNTNYNQVKKFLYNNFLIEIFKPGFGKTCGY